MYLCKVLNEYNKKLENIITFDRKSEKLYTRYEIIGNNITKI